MSDDYNSILKEKKVYTEPSHEKKHPLLKKATILGIFISLIMLIISYIIYFNTILTSESIFLNNTTKLLDKYNIFYDNLNFNYDTTNNYTFNGNIIVNNQKYDYSFIKDGNKLKRILNNGNNNITYYYDNDLYYIKMSPLNNEYVEINNNLHNLDYYNKKLNSISNNFDNYINDLLLNNTVNNLSNIYYNIDNYKYIKENIKNNYNSINSSKYIKKFYIEDKKPIVEIDLVIDTNDINNILGNKTNNLYINDDFKVSIIMKNDAIMNEIYSIKIIINNKTKNKRQVITYQNDELIFKDDEGTNDKLVYDEDSKNITLKYYKNDLLYSVLTGKLEDNQYIYMYQVIDQIYNIKLTINNKDNNYNYLLETNNHNKNSNFQISGTYSNKGEIIEDISKTFKYEELNPTLQNKFNMTINNILFSN